MGVESEAAALKGYGMEGFFITGWGYTEDTKETRKSTIDLDFCVTFGQVSWDSAGHYLKALEAPEDLSNPKSDYMSSRKFSKQITESAQSYLQLNGKNIHAHKVVYRPILDDLEYDSYLNVNDYVRRSKDGRLDAFHSDLPGWAKTALDIVTAAHAQHDPPGAIIEQAMHSLSENISGHADQDMKEWMKNTYIDNGRLIRRGT